MATDDEATVEARDEPRPAPARDHRGRWLKGTPSPNPVGRAIGSRNRASLAIDALLDGQAERITQKAVELALQGDTAALRICLERLCPPRRSRPVHLRWPPIDDMEAVNCAMTALLEGVALGELTVEEAGGVAALLAEKRDTLRALELERRLRALEARDVSGATLEAEILADVDHAA